MLGAFGVVSGDKAFGLNTGLVASTKLVLLTVETSLYVGWRDLSGLSVPGGGEAARVMKLLVFSAGS
jgi:hypothetical protein